MKKITFILVLALLIEVFSFGQCTYQVEHLAGEINLNGILISVTSEGFVDANSGYCINTKPYFIGYNYSLNTHGTGSYIFNFSPPVSMLTLNFSGISISSAGDGHIEEVQLFVNGAHYAIPAAGTLNGCDPLAVLTDEGNIRACEECILSGWMGTTINGPIHTLKVKDSVLVGVPGGTIFSLFICDSISSGIPGNIDFADNIFSPNPMTDNAKLKFSKAHKNVSFLLYSPNGICVRKIDNIKNGEFILTRDGLPQGLYFYTFQSDKKLITSGKIMIQY